MKTINFTKILAIILIFNSCSGSENIEKSEVIDLTMQFVRSDTINVTLPDTLPHLTSELGNYFNYDRQSFSYLTLGSGNSMHINRYFFETGHWTQIPLNLFGPNQVYGEGGYSLENNVLYYFPLNESKIITLSESGEKTNDYLYSDDRMVAYNSQVKSPNIHVENDLIFFDITEYRRLEDISTFEEAKLVGVYNVNNNSFKEIINYPKEFVGKAWSPNDVGRNFTVVGDKVYFNFSKSKYVYVYDLEGNLLKKSKVQVEGIKESQGLQVDDPYANALDQLNNGHYPRIIYDKWRKVFYRFGIHMDVDYELNSLEEIGPALRKRTLTLVAFDENLQVIALNEFSSVESGFSESFYFVNEDGLYLNAYFEHSPEENYNFIKLELKEIEKIN